MDRQQIREAMASAERQSRITIPPYNEEKAATATNVPRHSKSPSNVSAERGTALLVNKPSKIENDTEKWEPQCADISLQKFKVQKSSTFDDYLKEDKEKREDLQRVDDRYFTIHDVSSALTDLDLIKRGDVKKLEKEVLNIAAYFASEPIPIEIFVERYDVRLIRSVFYFPLLERYQKLIRNGLKTRNMEEKVLAEALKLFDKPRTVSRYLNHALSVWDYSQKYKSLISEFFHVPIYIVHDFIKRARYDEAHSFCEKLLSLSAKLPGDHPNDCELETKYNIGNIFLYKKNYSEALNVFEEILKSENLEHNGPLYLDVIQSKGHALHWQDRCDQAMECYKQVYVTSKAQYGENHPNTLFVESSMEAC